MTPHPSPLGRGRDPSGPDRSSDALGESKQHRIESAVCQLGLSFCCLRRVAPQADHRSHCIATSAEVPVEARHQAKPVTEEVQWQVFVGTVL